MSSSSGMAQNLSAHHTVLVSAIHGVVPVGAACWTVDATRCRTIQKCCAVSGQEYNMLLRRGHSHLHVSVTDGVQLVVTASVETQVWSWSVWTDLAITKVTSNQDSRASLINSNLTPCLVMCVCRDLFNFSSF